MGFDKWLQYKLPWLLIKDNQLKIQATIKYNRQSVHLCISEDTFGCKGQKTNIEWLEKNRNWLVCVTEVLQEAEGLQAVVDPYQYYQKSVYLRCSAMLFSWLLLLFSKLFESNGKMHLQIYIPLT